MTEVLVVGGGIVGSSVAYHLAAADVKVVLVDREDTGRATAAGAGILSPETSTSHDDAWYDLAVEAVQVYPELVKELSAAGVSDTGYTASDVLVVAVDREERPLFDAARERILDRQRRRGQPPSDELYELAPTEARERFPPLGDVHRALYYEGGAQVDGQTFAAALRSGVFAEGGSVRTGDVERLEIHDGVISGARVDGEPVSAEQVVIAGGAWSTAFADQLDVSIPVAPQRGQIAHLTVDAETANWPIVTAFHGHYLVPWPDGRVAAGATRETGSGFDPSTTVSGVREVLDE
ncbi:MAG: FAD-dependent oxidoreductase, partial [Halobacteriales archaeon]|nr:FAD-dependent oxidoreductase [Halobacteriales archaeon]